MESNTIIWKNSLVRNLHFEIFGVNLISDMLELFENFSLEFFCLRKTAKVQNIWHFREITV